MTSKAKRVAEALREHAEWACAKEWETPLTLGDDLAEAAELLENLAGEYKRLEKCNHECKVDCLLKEYDRVKAERDRWRARCKAAERDIREMLRKEDLECMCAFCAMIQCDECFFGDNTCATGARWRGPCAENGGADDDQ